MPVSSWCSQGYLCASYFYSQNYLSLFLSSIFLIRCVGAGRCCQEKFHSSTSLAKLLQLVSRLLKLSIFPSLLRVSYTGTKVYLHWSLTNLIYSTLIIVNFSVRYLPFTIGMKFIFLNMFSQPHIKRHLFLTLHEAVAFVGFVDICLYGINEF